MSEQNEAMIWEDVEVGNRVKVHDRCYSTFPLWGTVRPYSVGAIQVNLDNPEQLHGPAADYYREKGGQLPFLTSEVLEVRKQRDEQHLGVGDRVKAYDPRMMSRPVMGYIESPGVSSNVYRVKLDEDLVATIMDRVHGTTFNFYDYELTKVAQPQTYERGQRVRIVANHGPSEWDKYVGMFGTITGYLGSVVQTKYLVDIDGDFDEGPETVAASQDELEPVNTQDSGVDSLFLKQFALEVVQQKLQEATAERDRLTDALSEAAAHRDRAIEERDEERAKKDRAGERNARLNGMLSDERRERAKVEWTVQNQREQLMKGESGGI